MKSKEPPQVVLVKIDDIKLLGRVRPLNKQKVKQLAAAIKDQGLRDPILVYPLKEGYGLASGHHRLEAMKRLKESWIPRQAFIISKE